jgi:hypothetical protein
MVSKFAALTSLLVLGAAAACRTTPPAAWVAPGNPPECAAAIARARAAPDSLPGPEREVAKPLQISLPPHPVPASVRGRPLRVRVLVDERGQPDPAGVTVEGSADSGYARKLRRLALRYRFRPAREAGCWVPGLWVYHLTVAERVDLRPSSRHPSRLGVGIRQ